MKRIRKFYTIAYYEENDEFCLADKNSCPVRIEMIWLNGIPDVPGTPVLYI